MTKEYLTFLDRHGVTFISITLALGRNKRSKTFVLLALNKLISKLILPIEKSVATLRRSCSCINSATRTCRFYYDPEVFPAQNNTEKKEHLRLGGGGGVVLSPAHPV